MTEHFGHLLRMKDLYALEEIYSQLFSNTEVLESDQDMTDAKEYYDLILDDVRVAKKYGDEVQYRESMDRLFAFKNKLDALIQERK